MNETSLQINTRGVAKDGVYKPWFGWNGRRMYAQGALVVLKFT